MKIGSLFSGIGGLELGLERAGFGPVVWQVEIDPWCRKVLSKHWPNAERFSDVTQPRSYSDVELICGGFPCQDLSVAGKRTGLKGERSGLWYHFASVVSKLRPKAVIVENVASGKRRWLPTVRRDLHMLGYRTRAIQVSAFDVGAPHRRARVFVLATDTDGQQLWVKQRRRERKSRKGEAIVANDGPPRIVTNADGVRELQSSGGVEEFWRWSRDGDKWQIEPPVRGVDARLPRRVDRCGVNHDASEKCRFENLCDVRNFFFTSEIRDQAGGPDEVSCAQVLFGALRESEAGGEGLHQFVAGSCISDEDLRVLRGNNEASRASLRRKPREQYCGKHPNALLQLSQVVASQGEAAWCVPERSRPEKNRGRRLKALGNAVVPQCAEVVGRILRDWMNE